LDEDNVGNTANSQSREHRKFPASVRQHIPSSEGKPVKRKQVLRMWHSFLVSIMYWK